MSLLLSNYCTKTQTQLHPNLTNQTPPLKSRRQNKRPPKHYQNTTSTRTTFNTQPPRANHCNTARGRNTAAKTKPPKAFPKSITKAESLKHHHRHHNQPQNTIIKTPPPSPLLPENHRENSSFKKPLLKPPLKSKTKTKNIPLTPHPATMTVTPPE